MLRLYTVGLPETARAMVVRTKIVLESMLIMDVGARLPCLKEFEVLVTGKKSLKCVFESWMVIEREDLTLLIYTY